MNNTPTRRLTWILLAVHGVEGVLVAIAMYFLVSRVRDSIRRCSELNIAPPALSEYFLSVTSWVVTDYHWLPLVVLIFLAIDAVLLYFFRRDSGRLLLIWIWFWMVIVMPLAALGWPCLADILVRIKIMEALSR